MRLFLFIFFLSLSTLSFAAEKGRYFLEGDGDIAFTNKNTGAVTRVTYRNADGSYNTAAIKTIDQVFGLSPDFGEDISLRLISNLDFFQDKYTPGKPLTLYSGFRSPAYNQKLRDQKRKAGRTSYHIDGMAADVVFVGYESKKIWEDIRHLNCCGIGYYDGISVHIDSGRPRFWTTETALPKVDTPPQNKNIYLSIDKDIYLPGETMQLFFSGISDYPFGVKAQMELVRDSAGAHVSAPLRFVPQFPENKNPDPNACMVLKDRKDSRQILWPIPSDKKYLSGKLAVSVEFCDPITPLMPKTLLSRPFVIQ